MLHLFDMYRVTLADADAEIARMDNLIHEIERTITPDDESGEASLEYLRIVRDDAIADRDNTLNLILKGLNHDEA